MADNNKYFWLRLKKDFFKRHDIRIIEAMQNGKDYILFYLKLLCESVDHEGTLRFNDTIPYNEEMLSTITNTNIDIVRSAINVFAKLGMMELLDDGTFYMVEVSKMMGTSAQDDHTRESTRLRVAAYRERQRQKQLESEERYSNVTCNGEIDIELEKEKDIDIYNNTLGHSTCENDTNRSILFERFWKEYPKKVGKDKCLNWFKNKSRNITEDLVNQMIQALEVWKKSEQWVKDNGQYIPNPYTWLNRGGWNDELPKEHYSSYADYEVPWEELNPLSEEEKAKIDKEVAERRRKATTFEEA